MIPSASLLKSINLVLDENDINDFHRRKLKKKLKSLHKKGLLHHFPMGLDMTWRICAAELMQSHYHWWGWETRSKWAWELSNNKWFYPRWDGKPCKLLVIAEQGIGDEILFSSAFPDLLRQNPDTTIECDDRLIDLFTRSFGDHFVTRWRQSEGTIQERAYTLQDFRGEYDAFMMVGQVPKLYRRKKEDFKGQFLKAEKIDLSEFGDPPYIGISWKGKNACLDIEDLKEEGTLINLQYDASHPDLVETGIDLRDDFNGLASLLMSLDHVNSTTTAIAHLSGALGVKANVIKPPPVFGESNNRLKWYYGTKKKCDWYPSMTVYQNLIEWKNRKITLRGEK